MGFFFHLEGGLEKWIRGRGERDRKVFYALWLSVLAFSFGWRFFPFVHCSVYIA